MTSVYSFGEDSPLKFEISDKLAKYYNEAVEQFFNAQRRFNQKFGRQWDPLTDPIQIRWTRKQRKAWNDFAKVFKKTADQGDYHANDIMDDFLIKNIVTAAAAAGGQWDRAIGIAVLGGALHGFFNKR
jgi:N-acetylglucosamine kinase-like BadF-type ATPase